MSNGFESTDLKIRAKELLQLFPGLFGHIDFGDVLFFRIERMAGLALNLLPVSSDPWQYIIPYKYVLIAYKEFDDLSVDRQFTDLAHQLLKIPKGYKVKNIIKYPDVVMFAEEKIILDWLQDHKFNII